MKLIHFNLENDPKNFINILKNSEYYNDLLRFVCQQSNSQSESGQIED